MWENRSTLSDTIIKNDLLLQLLRDCNAPLANLHSYGLKTIVMQLIKQYPKDPWFSSDTPRYFILALNFLSKKLEEGGVGYFFLEDSNLLWNFKKGHLTNMQRWLSKTANELEQSMEDEDDCAETWKEYLYTFENGFS